MGGSYPPRLLALPSRPTSTALAPGPGRSYDVVGSGLDFEWDDRKAASNLRKHGVSFDEARSVFLDEDALFMPDPDHSAAEDRFLLLGLSVRLRILVVCHCHRSDDDRIRIISARRATPSERRQYEEPRRP